MFEPAESTAKVGNGIFLLLENTKRVTMVDFCLTLHLPPYKKLKVYNLQMLVIQ